MVEDVEILDEAQIELMSGWWKRSSPQRSHKSPLPNHYHKQNQPVPINPRCSAPDLALVFFIFLVDGEAGYGGEWKGESKSWGLPKKVTDLAS